MANKDKLVNEVIDVALESVNLVDYDKNSIDASTPLMGEPLLLDSVDVLEAVVAIEHHFKVKVKNAEEGQKYFQNFGTIADFIIENQSGPQ